MSQEPTFETALKKLEESVSQLEEGQLSLDEALACFEAGVQSANQCRTLLRDVEGRVEELLKKADENFATRELSALGHEDDA